MGTASSAIDRCVLSRPFPVEWAGFLSDTFSLQRSGWRLAVQRDIRGGAYDKLELIGEHRDARMRFLAEASFDRFPSDYLRYEIDHRQLPTFRVRAIAPDLHVRVIQQPGRLPGNYWENSFAAIDARPMEYAISELSMAQIFAPANTAAEEIFVEKADMSVIDHLQAIKELQAPIQARIREENRRREWLSERDRDSVAPRSQVLANVIQLVR